ncbi:hypothetical protein [Nocardia aurantiaca]|uniref:Uncharacterized protein n=1 Tax=Nocardia aurantiaca TaxID=2675850 RepID=A0A6I3L0I3_9NOCA|nr:hypothetical protein [Nocardia aurantiaca]MTE15261.1 hypothetical protein [Nocardia aurantiaca]
MVTIRNRHRSATTAAVLAALGASALLAAAPAQAANTISVNAAGASAVDIDYTCEASAGVASIQAMVGDPNAERPAATGTQTAVICDGSPHTTTIPLIAAAGEPRLATGAAVQVRAALVDQNQTVVSGTAKLVMLV